jgi:hypothetical protein
MTRRAALLNDRHCRRCIHRSHDDGLGPFHEAQSYDPAKRHHHGDQQSLLFAILFVQYVQVMANRHTRARSGFTEKFSAFVEPL